MNINE